MRHCLAFALVLATATSQATPSAPVTPDFNFVEGSYLRGRIVDDFWLVSRFDGLDLRGSRKIGRWLLGARAERLTTDRFEAVESTGMRSQGRTSLTVGGGTFFTPQEHLTIPVQAGIARAELKSSFFIDGESVSERESGTGYFVSLGLIAKYKNIEAEHEFHFRDVMGDQVFEQRSDLRFFFSPALALGIGHRDMDLSMKALTATLRWNF